MITVSETVEIRAPAEAVFAHVDDIRNLGWHMTSRRSMGMMGSRLRLEILSDQPTGLGATYHYSGTMLGLSIDFSESVTKYLPPREKVWRTIGEARLLIIASYEMRVAVEPLSTSSRVTISIGYELPRSGFWRIVGLVLARSYSRWCLRRMCRDTRRVLERRRDAEGMTADDRIYTCPMHPEVRQRGPGNCPKCGMTLEPVMATGPRDRVDLPDASADRARRARGRARSAAWRSSRGRSAPSKARTPSWWT